MKDNLRKYLLPNQPCFFILWFCLKLGTAYRLGGKELIHLPQYIGPAFAELSPGLNLFDWLVGIVSALLFRTFIYFRTQNAKKFRRDEEYGSARCGA